jgi:hypothetical protein
MKNLLTFDEFLNEGKLGLNKTVPTSTKEYTWIYQTGMDSVTRKTIAEINKKLNAMGIRSFIARTINDALAVPTGDLEKAYDEVISAYDNMKQFAYTDGTKINRRIVNEQTLRFGDFLHEAKTSSTPSDYIGKFIAANVEGSMNSDSRSGKWYASEVTQTEGKYSDEQIDFKYKGKNGSFFLDAILHKNNFYIFCDTMKEAEKICDTKNKVISGRREDRNLLRSSGRYM